jgi:hypothetical protein
MLFCSVLNTHAEQKFGKGADKSKLVSITRVLADPEEFIGKEITVSGKIDKVCKKRGCWMEFVANDPSERLRIKVKDGDMVFPVAAKGNIAFATGKISKRELTMKQTVAFFEHIAEEQGTDFNADDIKEPYTLVQLAPTGVTIE